MNAVPERVTNARAQSLTILNCLSDEQLNNKVYQDDWSIAQILEHLALMDQLVAILIRDGLQQVDDHVEKSIPLHRVTDRSVKVAAPKKLHPSDEPRTQAEIETLLNNSRRSLLEAVNIVDDASLFERKSPSVEHIVFGRMSLKQWIQLVGEHELRHIEQMKAVIS